MAFEKQLDYIDTLQRRNVVLGFAFALYRKANEDRISSLAALFSYYALFAIIPLLLILVSVLGVFLSSDPALRHRIVSSALANFPIIGSQIRSNVKSLNRTGVGLGVGLVSLVMATRGLSNAAQRSLNEVWNVPPAQRPGFPGSLWRGLAWTAIVGVGVTISTALSGISHGPTLLYLAASFGVNLAVFILAARVILPKSVRVSDFIRGSAIGAVIWQGLQYFGTLIVQHQLRHASAVYGFFAIVIGLLTWVYLLAFLTLYSAESDVVRLKGLWPRSVLKDRPTNGDVRSQALRFSELNDH